jgi:hypothetical protein
LATTLCKAVSKVSVESCAGVGVLKRSPANAPVLKSTSAHLIDDPPTSMPIAKREVVNLWYAL